MYNLIQGITEASELVKATSESADAVSTDSGAGYVMEPTQPIPDTELDSKSSGLNLSPREVVKTRAFWTLWFAFLFNGQGQLFVSTLYKVNCFTDTSFLYNIDTPTSAPSKPICCNFGSVCLQIGSKEL